MANVYGIHHNLTVAHSPWATGTAESITRSILKATRAIISELSLAPHDWPAVLPAVATALNEAGLECLGRNADGTLRSPLQVMTGIIPNRPIMRVITGTVDVPISNTLEQARANQVINIAKLQNDMDKLHKDVSESINERRQKAIRKHNAATNIITSHSKSVTLY